MLRGQENYKWCYICILYQEEKYGLQTSYQDLECILTSLFETSKLDSSKMYFQAFLNSRVQYMAKI